MQKLTKKQETFVAAYAANGGTNGTAAAREAGYVAPDVAAVRLLGSASVSAAVKERMGKSLARLERKRDYGINRTLEALHDLAFCDPAEIFLDDGTLRPLSEIPLHARRLITAIDSKRGVVKLSDAKGALDMLMRYHSLYKDKMEVTGGVTILRSSIPRPERPPKG